MAGPIRSLDDLARKGFDLNVSCPCGRYDRTIAIAEVRRLFRLLRRSEDWSGAHRRWRCSWCGKRCRTVVLRAYPSPPPGVLETLREAASRAMSEPVDTPAVQDVLLELGHLIGNENVQGFWKRD
jgi:hypothetical protein